MNFNYLPPRFKKGWKYGARPCLLKIERWAGTFAIKYFQVSSIKNFRNYFTKSSSAAWHSERLANPTAGVDFIICWNTHVDRYFCCEADVWCILQLMMHFLNYLTLSKIVLRIWKKNFFSATIILRKKVILVSPKMNLKISHKLR